MPIDEPLTWQISKIENTIPRGIQYVTLYQDRFNQHTDSVWYPADGDNPLPGQYTMLADYYELPDKPIVEDNKTEHSDITMKLTCGATQIYVGGNKVITATCMMDNADISEDMNYSWSYIIDGVDASALIKETIQTKPNKVKITFIGDESYVFKELVVKCVGTDGNGNTIDDSLHIGIIL